MICYIISMLMTSQIYLSFHPPCPGEPEYSKSKVETCIHDINSWMTASKLKLNNDKTELLVLHPCHCAPLQLGSIYARSELIIVHVATDLSKNIGIYFDNTLSMNKHVNSLCKTAFYHLHNLATIRRFLSHKQTTVFSMTWV